MNQSKLIQILVQGRNYREVVGSFCKVNKKEDKSFDLSSVVDQTLRISNLRFIEGLVQLQSFIEECLSSVQELG